MRWIVCLICLLTAATAQAATFTKATNNDGSYRIEMRGPIGDNDDIRFTEMAAGMPKGTFVFLASPGGLVNPAIKIGAYIHDNRFATVVGDNEQCASACGVIWLSGVPRAMQPNSHVGFHAIFVTENHAVSSSGNALVGAYYANLGLSYDAVQYLTTAPPNAMTWLTPQDARRYSIAYVAIPSMPGRATPILARAEAPARIAPPASSPSVELSDPEVAISHRLARAFSRQYRKYGMEGINASIDECYRNALTSRLFTAAQYCAALDVAAFNLNNALLRQSKGMTGESNSLYRVQQRTQLMAAAVGLDARELRTRAAAISVAASREMIDFRSEPEPPQQLARGSTGALQRFCSDRPSGHDPAREFLFGTVCR